STLQGRCIELDEAVGIMAGQVVYKYEEEQEND
ncbi:DUF1024 family protein, partial [Staphylococcus aureus]